GACGATQAGLDAISAGGFGAVEGGVGAAQSFFEIGRVFSRRDSQAQRDLDGCASRHDAAAGDVRAHALSQFPGFSQSAAGSNDQEFLAAVATDRVIGPDHRGNAAGDDAQDGVAGGVPTAVIYLLEVVDIDHDYADRLMITLGAEQFALQNFQDRLVIPQAGDAVTRGL